MDFGKVLRNDYGAPTYRRTKLLVSLLEQNRIASNLALEIFQNAEIQTPPSRNIYLLYPSMSSRALAETFLKVPRFWLRMRYGVHKSYSSYGEDTPWRHTQVLVISVK